MAPAAAAVATPSRFTRRSRPVAPMRGAAIPAVAATAAPAPAVAPATTAAAVAAAPRSLRRPRPVAVAPSVKSDTRRVTPAGGVPARSAAAGGTPAWPVAVATAATPTAANAATTRIPAAVTSAAPPPTRSARSGEAAGRMRPQRPRSSSINRCIGGAATSVDDAVAVAVASVVTRSATRGHPQPRKGTSTLTRVGSPVTPTAPDGALPAQLPPLPPPRPQTTARTLRRPAALPTWARGTERVPPVAATTTITPPTAAATATSAPVAAGAAATPRGSSLAAGGAVTPAPTASSELPRLPHGVASGPIPAMGTTTALTSGSAGTVPSETPVQPPPPCSSPLMGVLWGGGDGGRNSGGGGDGNSGSGDGGGSAVGAPPPWPPPLDLHCAFPDDSETEGGGGWRSVSPSAGSSAVSLVTSPLSAPASPTPEPSRRAAEGHRGHAQDRLAAAPPPPQRRPHRPQVLRVEDFAGGSPPVASTTAVPSASSGEGSTTGASTIETPSSEVPLLPPLAQPSSPPRLQPAPRVQDFVCPSPPVAPISQAELPATADMCPCPLLSPAAKVVATAAPRATPPTPSSPPVLTPRRPRRRSHSRGALPPRSPTSITLTTPTNKDTTASTATTTAAITTASVVSTRRTLSAVATLAIDADCWHAVTLSAAAAAVMAAAAAEAAADASAADAAVKIAAAMDATRRGRRQVGVLEGRLAELEAAAAVKGGS